MTHISRLNSVCPTSMNSCDILSADISRIIDTEVEKVVKALENLKRSYQDRASELNKEHIGVWIKEIAAIIPRWPPSDFDLVHEIRSQTWSTMNFVLDQYKDITRLDEPDDDQRTPLHVAMSENAVDCLEILLARGADPDVRSGNQTPFLILFDAEPWGYGSNLHCLPTFRAIFYLRNLVNVLPRPEHMAFTCREVDNQEPFKEYFEHQPIGLGKDILKGPWMKNIESNTYRTWIHVEITNASQAPRNIMAVANGTGACSLRMSITSHNPSPHVDIP